MVIYFNTSNEVAKIWSLVQIHFGLRVLFIFGGIGGGEASMVKRTTAQNSGRGRGSTWH